MIISFPHPPGSGGPGSFQERFEKALKQAGWTVIYGMEGQILPDLVMVIGGTKRLLWLWKMKRAGVPIVYRLDGINWLHRKKKVGLKRFLRGEGRNLLNKFIHAFIADHIVYQSQFVKEWWGNAGWNKSAKHSIIRNGVDLQEFKPNFNPCEKIKLLCLEGNIDYSPYAVELINELSRVLQNRMLVVVCGSFEDPRNQDALEPRVDYLGRLDRTEIHKAYWNVIYLSLDINAACPNTVVEALASGAPVVGFDTGALKELVGKEAGIIVDYGADPWSIQAPDAIEIVEGIEMVKANFNQYSQAARQRAEAHFNMDNVFDQYMKVVNSLINTTKSGE